MNTSTISCVNFSIWECQIICFISSATFWYSCSSPASFLEAFSSATDKEDSFSVNSFAFLWYSSARRFVSAYLSYKASFYACICFLSCPYPSSFFFNVWMPDFWKEYRFSFCFMVFPLNINFLFNIKSIVSSNSPALTQVQQSGICNRACIPHSKYLYLFFPWIGLYFREYPQPPQYNLLVSGCFSLFRFVEYPGLNAETCSKIFSDLSASWWFGMIFHSSLRTATPSLFPTDFLTVFPYAISPR